MNDSDPRPMPPQVLAAYRDPLNLTELLSSEVFTDRDRLAVRDELLDRLTKKHGNVEVEIGNGARTLPIRKRVAQFRKNVLGSIPLMVEAEEFGGRDAVMLELAAVMQPYWLLWWETMGWYDYSSTQRSLRMSACVLGDRQLIWLAAQYARSVIDLTRPSERQYCLNAISATESWATVPSEDRLESVSLANNVVYFTSGNAARAAQYAAYAVDFSEKNPTFSCWSYVADTAVLAARAIPENAEAPTSSEVTSIFNRISSITKRLITPTLITRASRGLR